MLIKSQYFMLAVMIIGTGITFQNCAKGQFQSITPSALDDAALSSLPSAQAPDGTTPINPTPSFSAKGNGTNLSEVCLANDYDFALSGVSSKQHPSLCFSETGSDCPPSLYAEASSLGYVDTSSGMLRSSAGASLRQLVGSEPLPKTFSVFLRVTEASRAVDKGRIGDFKVIDCTPNVIPPPPTPSSACSNDPTFGSNGNDADWNLQHWNTANIWPSSGTEKIANGDFGTAIRFTASPAAATGITTAGVVIDFQQVTGEIEALISTCPHDFTAPVVGTSVDGQPCYLAYGGNQGNLRYLTFNGSQPHAYDCPLLPGKTYYINFRALRLPRSSVSSRFAVSPR